MKPDTQLLGKMISEKRERHFNFKGYSRFQGFLTLGKIYIPDVFS
jgi:hypothetical protein